MNKAFLLDRDGTINIDSGYVMSPDKVQLLDGVGEAIHKMNKAGYLVIVVSNQSGVARGMGTIEDVKRVNAKIEELLCSYDAKIDAFYFCPHYIDGIQKEYAIDCECRKPKLGLFRKAIDDYHLNTSECIAVGDKLRDVENLGQLGIMKLAVINESNNCSYKSLLSFTHEIIKGDWEEI